MRKKAVLSLAVAVLLTAGIIKRHRDRFITESFYAMGTVVSITLPAKNISTGKDVENLIKHYSKTVWEDTKLISKTDGFSEISFFTYTLLEKEREYRKYTPKFRSTAGTLSSLYGFPSGPYKIPSKEELEAAVRQINTYDILLKEENGKYYANAQGLHVDTGAFAKGSIADIAGKMLLEQNISSFIINAGGDMLAMGTKNGARWSVGIVNPDKNGSPHAGIIYPHNSAVATSGNYERYFVEDGIQINHIFDAETGHSVNNYKSVSVTAPTAEEADAMATIFYLMTVDEIAILCEKTEYSVLIIANNNDIIKLCGWGE